MRKKLEASSAQKGRSLTQEMLSRLNRSFDRERDEQRDPALGALCYLLAKVVEIASDNAWVAPGSNKRDWIYDPFVFRATKLAFSKLLDMLEPKGEIRPRFTEQQIREVWPAELVEQALAENSSPVAKADFAAGFIWRQLQEQVGRYRAERLSELSGEEQELVRGAARDAGAAEAAGTVFGVFEDLSRGMAKAAEDLGLNRGPQS
jgi:hypothetical protein